MFGPDEPLAADLELLVAVPHSVDGILRCILIKCSLDGPLYVACFYVVYGTMPSEIFTSAARCATNTVDVKITSFSTRDCTDQRAKSSERLHSGQSWTMKMVEGLLVKIKRALDVKW